MASDPAAHANDTLAFDLPSFILGDNAEIHLPVINIFGYEMQITKYMVIELAVAITLFAVFIPLAKSICTGKPPKGRFWNLFEVFLLFLRDQVIQPGIGGKKDAAPYVPYLWTLFFFILFCNLFGLLPWSGSPTGSMGVTVVLALGTFFIGIVSGMRKHGLGGYWLGLVPHMELPFVLAIVLKPLLFAIELLSLLIKHVVLSIRLWANMFAGHLVLFVFLSFIALAANSSTAVWLTATGCSTVMCVAMTLLELLVAFLQAYIFTFLSSLYIGSALHQH